MLLICLFSAWCNPSFSQEKKVSLNLKNATLQQVFAEIEKQNDVVFIYRQELIDNANKVSITCKDANLNEILRTILAKSQLNFIVKGKQIVITTSTPLQAATPKNIKITGKVITSNGSPIPGTAVIIKGSLKGTTTDSNGEYSIEVPENAILIFSFLGYQKQEIAVRGKTVIDVVLTEEADVISEVVVTGIFTRKREDFTGSASTFNRDELKAIGNTNIIQSLKTLDPSFAVIENNLTGSDPNRLPNVEIRGKSSIIGVKDELAEDPNQPLFILDGFESSLRAIFDLDMDRIASITILKDAASTAIYGSKAANGVVVVETIKPVAGQLRFSYNGSFNVSIPDLSSYNMMNSAEKLEFERLAGRYNLGTSWTAEKDVLMNQLYNEKLQDVARGINTYWLSEPLRIGINQKHSIYAHGGEGGFTFGLGAVYNGITGVMKASKRNNISGNLDVNYRISKFQFSNKLQVGTVNSQDPIVSFKDYVNANPYYSKLDDNGERSKWLEYNTLFQAPNPMWNDNVGSRDKNKEFNFSNFFMAEYTPLQFFKIRARFGITYSTGETDNFISPNDTRYDTEDILNKGAYYYRNSKSSKVEGELTATYAKLIKNHRINLVLGGNLNSQNSLNQGYTVKGFPQGDFTYPSFSKGFPEGGSPVYVQAQSRSISGFFNGGYSYNDRYNMDLSYRLNGSSVFGTTKQFSGTWSMGLAWNLHKESFINKNFQGIKMLKIRGSIGNPGNQNFSSYMTLTTYKFNFNVINYFGLSSIISSLGNPDLKWQKTLDKNIGFDMTIMNNRLNIIADYYHKTTDPLLVSIEVPSSAGVTLAYTNLGNQVTKGFTATMQYYLIYKLENRFTWNVRANIRSYKSQLGDLGNSLNEMNKLGQNNNSLQRYYDGADPEALWAVRSAGIDPSTGREIYYTKEGAYTYDYSYDNEVVIGNSRPKIEGILGSSLNYKGFSINFDFRYRAGCYSFNNALFSKVENISSSGLNYNQDKRALYERWKEPGDIAKFKDIANSLSTPMSSRFIQRDNSITLESLRIGYEFYGKKLKETLGIGTIKINAYMNDIFRISTIKAERGITYPFAQSVSFSLSLTF
ncbi:MAG: SusC/RagA family TonB-linked outer membrane protein [Bacteroidales bacterium]|nr:SusC/RagA family TonB-linked outer membrane protein [Bacteroidales bacterium]MDD3990246.1 SusC/RagA family TonB-linked outer membrane protein [Bacteroidales bacterium]